MIWKHPLDDKFCTALLHYSSSSLGDFTVSIVLVKRRRVCFQLTSNIAQKHF